jgi:small subunit ribosomal protein S5
MANGKPTGGMIDKVVHIDRSAVAKGGGVSALVVVGDGRGRVGFGSGKAKGAPAAIRQGIEAAKKSMIGVAMIGGTIPFAAVGRHGAEKVLLRPAGEGTGIVAGAPIKAILESAGIRNILTKTVGSDNPLSVVKATFDALKNLPADVVAAFPEDLPSSPPWQDQMRRMIEAMTPPNPVPLPPQVLQALRNATARDEVLREFGAFTSADVGKMAGSKSPNRAALAHRWKSDGRIFSVLHNGANYFPGFQFSREGQPLPVIAEVLKILGHVLSPWELAIWFWKNNGVLGGERAVDLLTSAPGRVIDAAKEETEELVF